MENEETVSSEAPSAVDTAPVESTPEIQSSAEGTVPAEVEAPVEGAENPDANAEVQQEWDAELLEAASKHGFSKEDYPSEAALKRAMTAFEKQIAVLGGLPQQAEQQPEAQTTQPQQQMQPPPVQQQPQAPAGMPQFKFNREIFSEEVANEMENMLGTAHQYYEQKLSEMSGAVGYLIEQQRHRDYEAFQDWFDSSLTNIVAKDVALKEVLGEGNRHVIDQKSEPAKVRDAIQQNIFALMAGYQRTGRNVPSKEQLLKSAIAIATQDRAAEIERKRIAASLQKQKGRVVARPGGRRDGDDFGDAAAESVVAAWKKKHNLTD